jgi:hypothetical protein
MPTTIANQMNAIIALVLSSSSTPITAKPLQRPDTLKGVDDLIHSGFEAYRASCFNWLLAATALVVVGLALEGPELWNEIFAIIHRWRFKRRFHFSLPEEHGPDWVTFLAFVGWLTIVFGVAGEYVADSFVSKADGYVQTFDEILLTEARTRTSAASERAAMAFERASQNEKETAATLQQVQKERSDAAESLEVTKGYELQIAQANERAAKASREAAAANLEIAKLKAPRQLSCDPQSQARAILNRFPGTPFDLWVNSDSESTTLAAKIENCLNAAGWKEGEAGTPIGFTRAGKPTWGLISGTGVEIQFDEDQKSAFWNAAEALVGALKLELPDTVGHFTPDHTRHAIHIRIGSKL